MFKAVLTFLNRGASLWTRMNPSTLRIRRATTEDFQSLRGLWNAMRFPLDELERRLTEFQVVETAGGQLVGAIGLQITGQHALLHSEGYTDFALADAARPLFWERFQTIAAHKGVFRIWTQENAPFWARWGFQPAAGEILERLPKEWKPSGEKWLTFQIKDEEAIAVLEKELALFREAEKKRTAETLGKARTLTNLFTTSLLILGAILICAAIYLFVHRVLTVPLH